MQLLRLCSRKIASPYSYSHVEPRPLAVSRYIKYAINGNLAAVLVSFEYCMDEEGDKLYTWETEYEKSW